MPLAGAAPTREEQLQQERDAVLEAMASELPIVATRIAGVPRAIDDNQNGLLVEPGCWGVLRDRLREMLVFPDRRAKLAAAARESVVERFGFAKRMESIVNIYRDVLSTPEPQIEREPAIAG